MITVNDRTISVPTEDKFLGVVGDNEVETRQFEITNMALSEYDFVLDIRNGAYYDSVKLVKTVDTSKIVLTWEIKEAHLAQNGVPSIWIRAFNSAGVEKWNTIKSRDFIIQEGSNVPGAYPEQLPSEFITMEQRVTAAKNETIATKTFVLQKETEILNIKTDAEEIARSVRNDAENGVFDGAKGDKGDTGAQGERGEQGIQGVQGEKGDKGDKGDTGAQGIQGVPYVSDIIPVTGGALSAAENKIYRINISESTTITNAFNILTDKHLQTMIYIKMSATASVTWTGFTFVNDTIPTLINGNCYRAVLEFNPLKNSVVVGVIHDGAVV